MAGETGRERTKSMGIIGALIKFQRENGYNPSMDELGAMMSIERATVSQLVNRLAADGLVVYDRTGGSDNRVAPRTIRIQPGRTENLSPTLLVGTIKQPDSEYLWIGPRGLLLTPEEQIGLMNFLLEKWGADRWIDNPLLTVEQAAQIRKGFGDPDALLREMEGPFDPEFGPAESLHGYDQRWRNPSVDPSVDDA